MLPPLDETWAAWKHNVQESPEILPLSRLTQAQEDLDIIMPLNDIREFGKMGCPPFMDV